MVHLLLQLTTSSPVASIRFSCCFCSELSHVPAGAASIVALVLSFLALVVATHEATINTINTKQLNTWQSNTQQETTNLHLQRHRNASVACPFPCLCPSFLCHLSLCLSDSQRLPFVSFRPGIKPRLAEACKNRQHLAVSRSPVAFFPVSLFFLPFQKGNFHCCALYLPTKSHQPTQLHQYHVHLFISMFQP